MRTGFSRALALAAIGIAHVACGPIEAGDIATKAEAMTTAEILVRIPAGLTTDRLEIHDAYGRLLADVDLSFAPAELEWVVEGPVDPASASVVALLDQLVVGRGLWDDWDDVHLPWEPSVAPLRARIVPLAQETVAVDAPRATPPEAVALPRARHGRPDVAIRAQDLAERGPPPPPPQSGREASDPEQTLDRDARLELDPPVTPGPRTPPDPQDPGHAATRSIGR